MEKKKTEISVLQMFPKVKHVWKRWIFQGLIGFNHKIIATLGKEKKTSLLLLDW